MNRHYILQLNPQASSDWDRCVLRNPITGERPDLNAEVAKELNNQTGSYLIKVSLEVEVLEQNLADTREPVKLPLSLAKIKTQESKVNNPTNIAI